MLSKLVTLLLLLPAALLVTTTTAFAYDDHVEEFEIYVNRTERLKAEDTASPGSGSDRFSAPFYLNGSTTKLGTFFDKQIATPISTTATVDHG